MNQTKLEELAASYSIKQKHGLCDYMNGVYDYLDNVWHSAKEIPDGRAILTECVHGYDIMSDYDPEITELPDFTFGVKRWAYIEDLLPRDPKQRKEVSNED